MGNKIKKGFTLAEILIVLMVIGVIAVMTIPSMMKGVTEAQYKTNYKKAYQVVSNFVAMEKLAGSLPTRGNQGMANRLMFALDNVLNVNFYAHQVLDAGTTPEKSRYYSCADLNFRDGTIATIGTKKEGSSCIGSEYLPQTSQLDNTQTVGTPVWINTEDNVAYTVLTGYGSTCATKAVIQAQKSLSDIIKQSCFVIIVDVNGSAKGPNTVEPQTQKFLDGNKAMDTLVGDQYQIYVGIDGVTAGPRLSTVTGRIMAGLK